MYTEQQAADWLVDLINDGTFLSVIQNLTKVEAIMEVIQDKNTVPGFSVDVMSRHRAALAATYVLSLCDSMELVSVNTSISRKTGEVLRPDIVAFNPEKQALIVFEIKRKQVSEREAITELIGYEQEIRNHFPFASELDIGFVLISEEWSPMLNHSVTSLVTWHQKNCLCLTIEAASPLKFSLSAHIPEAWQLLGSVGLRANALQTVEIRPSNEESRNSVPYSSVITATQLIARKGDLINSHGFVVVWSSPSPLAEVSWFITVCILNPQELFHDPNPYLPEVRRSEFRDYFDKSAKVSYEDSQTVGRFTLIDDAINLLEGYQEIEFSGISPWHDTLNFHKLHSVPRFFEFWGVLGEHARAFTCHPGVRDWFMPYIKRSSLDWTHPYVAIPLIDDLSGKRPLLSGEIECSDAFEAGFRLGNLLVGYRNQPEDEDSLLVAVVWWAETAVLQLSIEIADIYNSAVSLREPPPPLNFQRETRGECLLEYLDWIEKNLITDDHPMHADCFQLGVYFSELFDCASSMFSPAVTDEQYINDGTSRIKKILMASIEKFTEAIENKWISDESRAFLLKLQTEFFADVDLLNVPMIKKTLDSHPCEELCKRFVELILPAANSITLPIRFERYIGISAAIDWERLQMGIRLMFESGYKWPAVKLAANGLIGTAPLNPEATKIFAPLSDPNLEVFLELNIGLYPTTTRTTWEKLKKMEIFQKKQSP